MRRRDEKEIKRVISSRIDTTRPLGRPKKRCREGIRDDLEGLGYEEQMAENRKRGSRVDM